MNVEVTFAKAFVVPPPGQVWLLQFPEGMSRDQLDQLADQIQGLFVENPPVIITGCSVVEAIR
jgi:hypothetical protein